MCAHTCTRSHTHTRLHAHVPSHTRPACTHAHTHSHPLAHTCTHPFIYTCTHPLSHTCLHTCTHQRACTCTHAPKHTHRLTNTHTYTPAHKCMHTLAHTHTCTHTPTLTHCRHLDQGRKQSLLEECHRHSQSGLFLPLSTVWTRVTERRAQKVTSSAHAPWGWRVSIQPTQPSAGPFDRERGGYRSSRHRPAGSAATMLP